jgi:nucleoside diphosphate kinase
VLFLPPSFSFDLIARKKLHLTPAQVKQLYLNDASKPFFKAASEFMCSGPVLCLALRKNSALTDLHALVGPENPKAAKKSAPHSIRAQYGTDVNRNAIHCPASIATNSREVALLFGEFNFDLLG